MSQVKGVCHVQEWLLSLAAPKLISVFNYSITLLDVRMIFDRHAYQNKTVCCMQSWLLFLAPC